MLNGNAALKVLREGIQLPNGQILRLERLESLSVDTSYQRDLVRSSRDRIMEAFDERAIGVFHVGQRKRSNKKNVLDGQNRRAAMIELKQAKKEDPATYADVNVPDEVLCIIEDNTSVEEEATIFKTLNTNKPVTGSARFKASVTANDDPETKIAGWIKQEGFSLDYLQGRPTDENTKPNGIRSVAILRECYNKCEEHLLAALKFLKAIYDNKVVTIPRDLRTGAVIYGIAMFIAKSTTKDVKVLTGEYKKRALSLTVAWKDAKSAPAEKCFQRDTSKLLAEWLLEHLGNGEVKTKVRRKAA